MFLLNKKLFRHFDWINFFLITSLACIGLLFIFSATYRPEQPFSIFFKKQTFGVIAGLFLYLICSAIDYRTWIRLGYFFYIVALGLLAFTLIKGSIGMGAQRWISLFFFRLQTSELAKLLFPAFIAHYLQTHKMTEQLSFRHFIPLIFVLLISTFLILKQPDLGTAIIVFVSGIVLLWMANINKKFFLYGSLIFLMTAPLSWNFLKDYQKKRVTTFLGQGKSKKERYQIEQSHIAIGSGGIFGKGILQGTQNRFLFLPESRTDFIFSVLCEELGFTGAILILLLYFILFVRIISSIFIMQTPIMQIFAVGLTIHILLSTIINLAMVTGLLPIVGIPLPFMSYGLSNLWITFISLGWFHSVSTQKTYVVE
ncbi:rod shape-determining protein RodA [bacterium]|nr:rod shape-determining protein RodA [bacterium]